MSEIIDVEWFDKGATGLPNQTIGVVLIYNEHDGFKCYIGIGNGASITDDTKFIYEHGTKLGHAAAKGIWGSRMRGEWISRNLANNARMSYAYKYDGKRYSREKVVKS